jgi:nucleotide-binding universal stress UspA family protein
MSQQPDVFEEVAREFIRSHQERRPPRRIDRILVATDFSLCSLAALEYAEELARRFRAELLVLHAENQPLAGAEMPELTHQAVERELARAVQQLRADGLDARGLLRPGAPLEEIPEAARTERASLIVMGHMGAGAPPTC